MSGNKKDSKTNISDATKKNEDENVELVIYLLISSISVLKEFFNNQYAPN
jgi:hypothetical protein